MTSTPRLRLVGTLLQDTLIACFSAGVALGQTGMLQSSPTGAENFATPSVVSPAQETIPQKISPLSDESQELMEEKVLAARPAKKTAPASGRSEIKCAVYKWEKRLPNPVLTLVCPPEEIFSPIHVYVKFGWKKLEDIPKNFAKIVATVGSQTKIKAAKENFHVWLKAGGDDGGNNQEKWVTFNRVDGVALEGE